VIRSPRADDRSVGAQRFFAMSTSQPQAINLADLDVAQLSDVKRQLEEVRSHFIFVMLDP
jgi:hypothetical protein